MILDSENAHVNASSSYEAVWVAILLSSANIARFYTVLLNRLASNELQSTNYFHKLNLREEIRLLDYDSWIE